MDLSQWLRIVGLVGVVIAMIMGLYLVFARLKEKNQGFGPNSIQALGLVIFLPSLVIIALTVPSFQSETLAALLGTVAGYVLSRSKPDEG